MTQFRIAGTAAAALAVVALTVTSSAMAGDLGPYAAGSAKDGYVPLPRVMQSPGAGPCYLRADVGYSWSADPGASFPVFGETFDYADTNPADGYADGDTNQDGVIDAGEVTTGSMGSAIANASLENTWLGEIGAGCGSGSRGLRAEVMLGFRGSRDFDGVTAAYQGGTLVGSSTANPPPALAQDAMSSSLRTTTLMVNAYYDLGKFGRFVPYVGAGIGAAYHELDNIAFATGATTQINGNNDLAFAWSLMAGVGIQLTDRAILDVGYRYIDTGSISSESSGTGSRVTLDDLTAHEIKVGLRYHFGGGCCDVEPEPFK